MAANAPHETSSNYVNFHFEYALVAKTYSLDGISYTGIDVLAKMIDALGNEETEHVQDVTTEPETAWELINLLDVFKVSPMCLKAFVDDFLSSS